MISKFLIPLLAAALPLAAFELPAKSTQCVLATAETWNSSTATVRLYEKSGNAWKPVGEAWQARLGKSGLVWGKGMHPVPKGVVTKKEGDGRSPAGVFAIGGAWGYAASIPKNAALSYKQITSRDLWVEDPGSPKYNEHILLDHEPATPWEKKQQMRQEDDAHSLKLFIAHNAPPNVTANDGSSIFFHIWRGGGSKATAGCTTMEQGKLQWLISKMDPAKRPVYVLLPKEEYGKVKGEWGLP